MGPAAPFKACLWIRDSHRPGGPVERFTNQKTLSKKNQPPVFVKAVILVAFIKKELFW